MKKEDLRLVFMGTPEFAVETLRRIVEGGYKVAAVVTQPDKPVGRHGSVAQQPPVKQYALSVGIPVLQPERLKDPAFVERLRRCGANLHVVVAFRMLPEVVWAMPEYGTFNVHASLLPQYRGAAPINWAVINGETQTGVTTFFLDRNMDTGNILERRTFDIPDSADAEYVHDGLMHLGAEIALSTLEKIAAADGHPATVAQDGVATAELHPAPKLFKENCRIDWGMTAKQVYDFVRGLSPSPGAWTTLTDTGGRETALKVYSAAKTGTAAGGVPPGTITADRKSLHVACADELLRVESLQLAGKKRMDTQTFLNGMKDMEKYSAR